MENSNDQRFSAVPGIPDRDDPELSELMEAVRRMPTERKEVVIESILRCALGFERTGNAEFQSRALSNALGTFRSRRDPEDQKALDAVPPTRQASGDAEDVDVVLARLGYI